MSNYFQMYNALPSGPVSLLAYSKYKYLNDYKNLDNKDQYKTKHCSLIRTRSGKVVRERNKLRKPSNQEFNTIENSKGYQFVIIQKQQNP